MGDLQRQQCLVVGGGPAGLMLGVLLARAGVRVRVLEKHADFLRDFRGDTIHPSTLEVIHELGWLDRFLRLPHQKVERLSADIGGERIEIADFTHLPVQCRFIAMMPQWDFLNFLAEKGRAYPGFTLSMQSEAIDLVWRDGRVTGVVTRDASGADERLEADLVVAADGRGSVLRDKAGMKVMDLGAPMDVMWFRLPQEANDPQDTLGRIEAGHIFIKLNRGDYWQCAYVFDKGKVEAVRARGIEAFRADVARLAGIPEPRARDAIPSFDDVRLLNVKVDRLKTWSRPGFLCIGDAAHAMSPVGGVGVNLAVQDAVAAANLLWQPLLYDRLSEADVMAVQDRRQWPTRVTQALQVFAQNRFIGPALAAKGDLKPPPPMRLIRRWPILERVPARLVGLGVRPEHVSRAIRAADGRAASAAAGLRAART